MTFRDDSAEFLVRENGPVFFYSERRPRQVRCNNKKISFRYDGRLKKLMIQAKQGDTLCIE